MEEQKEPIDSAASKPPASEAPPVSSEPDEDFLDEQAIAELLRNAETSNYEDDLPPMSVLILWGSGLLVGAASIIWFIASLVSVCSPNDSMCSMNTLFNMMFSSTGMFGGVMLFVSGLFALRRSRRR